LLKIVESKVLNKSMMRLCGHFVTSFVYQIIQLYEYMSFFVKITFIILKFSCC